MLARLSAVISFSSDASANVGVEPTLGDAVAADARAAAAADAPPGPGTGEMSPNSFAVRVGSGDTTLRGPHPLTSRKDEGVRSRRLAEEEVYGLPSAERQAMLAEIIGTLVEDDRRELRIMLEGDAEHT